MKDERAPSFAFVKLCYFIACSSYQVFKYLKVQCHWWPLDAGSKTSLASFQKAQLHTWSRLYMSLRPRLDHANLIQYFLWLFIKNHCCKTKALVRHGDAFIKWELIELCNVYHYFFIDSMCIFCSTCSSSLRSSAGMRSPASSQRRGSEAPSGSPATRGRTKYSTQLP